MTSGFEGDPASGSDPEVEVWLLLGLRTPAEIIADPQTALERHVALMLPRIEAEVGRYVSANAPAEGRRSDGEITTNPLSPTFAKWEWFIRNGYGVQLHRTNDPLRALITLDRERADEVIRLESAFDTENHIEYEPFMAELVTGIFGSDPTQEPSVANRELIVRRLRGVFPHMVTSDGGLEIGRAQVLYRQGFMTVTLKEVTDLIRHGVIPKHSADYASMMRRNVVRYNELASDGVTPLGVEEVYGLVARVMDQTARLTEQPGADRGY